MENGKIIVSKIKKYLKTVTTAEKEIPTLAGMAVFLGMPKSELLALADCEDRAVKEAYLRAKSIIEHTILTKSAFKEISSTMARFYLTSSDFAAVNPTAQEEGYADISLFIEEGD